MEQLSPGAILLLSALEQSNIGRLYPLDRKLVLHVNTQNSSHIVFASCIVLSVTQTGHTIKFFTVKMCWVSEDSEFIDLIFDDRLYQNSVKFWTTNDDIIKIDERVFLVEHTR